MLVSVDKRGSVSLPAAIRKNLNLHPGSFLDLSVLDGGNITLSPVVVYPVVRLSEKGLTKLAEARQGGVEQLPDWLRKEISDASTDPE